MHINVIKTIRSNFDGAEEIHLKVESPEDFVLLHHFIRQVETHNEELRKRKNRGGIPDYGQCVVCGPVDTPWEEHIASDNHKDKVQYYTDEYNKNWGGK